MLFYSRVSVLQFYFKSLDHSRVIIYQESALDFLCELFCTPFIIHFTDPTNKTTFSLTFSSYWRVDGFVHWCIHIFLCGSPRLFRMSFTSYNQICAPSLIV